MKESNLRGLIPALVVIGILLCISSAGAGQKLGTRERPIYMLLVPSTEATGLETRGGQIAQALYKITGLYIEASLQADYTAMIEAFAASDGDTFGFPTTEQYIRIYELTKGKITPRLGAVRRGYPYYFSRIYAPRDSDIDSVEDLQGKTWIYSYTSSTSGYVLPKKLFDRLGITFDSQHIVESGGHINSMVALLEGQGDFCTGYGNPPIPPSDWSGTGWKPGDDPELWIWDRWKNDLYRAGLRGTCMDLRRGVSGLYDIDQVIKRIGVIKVIGPIPNDCLAFGPEFPEDIADRIVNAVKEHIATEEGKALWGEGFYGWTAVTDIDDSYYDSYRELLGLPIPNRADPTQK
jgi:phosphonate transport system substrate-binding protein